MSGSADGRNGERIRAALFFAFTRQFPFPGAAVERVSEFDASEASPGGGELRKSPTPHPRHALPAGAGGESRDAFPHPSYETLTVRPLSDSSPPDLIRWSMMPKFSGKAPVGALGERNFRMECRVFARQ